MFDSKEEQELFLKKYNISPDRFRLSLLTWEELSNIARDYDGEKIAYNRIAEEIGSNIQQCGYVHSLSFRVKNTEHLIEKIIRKNVGLVSKGDCITSNNYKKHITDLVGIRVLLLFKEDWIHVNDFINEHYVDVFNEEPFVYIRKGDDQKIYEDHGLIIKNKGQYRSAHYVIKTEDDICAEIQVRTLFEEAWSEIDHKISYPYNLGNEMINRYLKIINSVSGLADEMGSFINQYILKFNAQYDVISDNEAYNKILDEIKECSDAGLRTKIIDIIRSAESFSEQKLVSDVLDDFL